MSCNTPCIPCTKNRTSDSSTRYRGISRNGRSPLCGRVDPNLGYLSPKQERVPFFLTQPPVLPSGLPRGFPYRGEAPVFWRVAPISNPPIRVWPNLPGTREEPGFCRASRRCADAHYRAGHRGQASYSADHFNSDIHKLHTQGTTEATFFQPLGKASFLNKNPLSRGRIPARNHASCLGRRYAAKGCTHCTR